MRLDSRMLASGLRAGIVVAALQAAPAAAIEFLNCAAAKDKAWCESSLTRLRVDAALARRGDYQGMRNIALCLSSVAPTQMENPGCDGAVVPDPVSGCAWRVLIIERHGNRGNDDANLRIACGSLTPLQMQLVQGRAAQIRQQIAKSR
jgi:hypothetical protein